MIRHAVLPVPIPAVIHVIAAAMIPVRPEHLKTTPVPMLLPPNAVRAATDVRIVHPAKLTGTVLMSDLRNAVAVITALILAVPERKAALPAQVIMYQRAFLLPNAVPAVMNADITPIVTLLPNHALTAVLIQTLAVSAHPASPVPTAVLQDQLLSLAPVDRRKRLSGQLNAETLVIHARKIMIRMNVHQKKEPIMAKIIGAEQWIISREII